MIGCGQLTERGETLIRSAHYAVWAGDGPMRIGGGNYALRAHKPVSVRCLGRGQLPKAGISAQARVWADVLYNRQSYERRELSKVRWIGGSSNPADTITKSVLNKSVTG
jgi:hypothetical protein